MAETPTAATTLRPADRAILDALGDAPLTTREISDSLLDDVRRRWCEERGYVWDELVGMDRNVAGCCAVGEARREGLLLSSWEIDRRLRALEKRGAVERIQIEGRRPMLWSRRV